MLSVETITCVFPGVYTIKLYNIDSEIQLYCEFEYKHSASKRGHYWNLSYNWYLGPGMSPMGFSEGKILAIIDMVPQNRLMTIKNHEI